jgi:hypothetical protein
VNLAERTFSSSSFFSLKLFLFRAVSSRLSASSESVRRFFLEEFEGGSSGDEEDTFSKGQTSH